MSVVCSSRHSTKLSTVIYLYIQLSICILLLLIYLFFLILFIICVFCSVTVILLRCGSFCHENKFHVCINIPGNKAHSDSDSDPDHGAEAGLNQEAVVGLSHGAVTGRETVEDLDHGAFLRCDTLLHFRGL